MNKDSKLAGDSETERRPKKENKKANVNCVLAARRSLGRHSPPILSVFKRLAGLNVTGFRFDKVTRAAVN